MSEFHVEVVRLGEMNPHPHADTLDITKVYDYTVIVKRGEWKEGDLAVYLPLEAVVPDIDRWSFFIPKDATGQPRYQVGNVPQRYRTIDAKKIRGIFSQGMLAKLPPGNWSVGDDVREAMGIVRWEPPQELSTGGECEAAPRDWHFVKYTDIEGLRRYPSILTEGEEVVITEKIHGANARYVHDGTRLWVGSHGQIKAQDSRSIWWSAAAHHNLEEKLSRFPFLVFFGEVFGRVQDLRYGCDATVRFRAFDIFDIKGGRYLNHDAALEIAAEIGVDWVPILHRGPWHPDLNDLCEGKSTLATHVREGFVVKPVIERYDDQIGRVILKRHGEGYLLRQKKDPK